MYRNIEDEKKTNEHRKSPGRGKERRRKNLKLVKKGSPGIHNCTKECRGDARGEEKMENTKI